jgi:hypothetical protein
LFFFLLLFSFFKNVLGLSVEMNLTHYSTLRLLLN